MYCSGNVIVIFIVSACMVNFWFAAFLLLQNSFLFLIKRLYGFGDCMYQMTLVLFCHRYHELIRLFTLFTSHYVVCCDIGFVSCLIPMQSISIILPMLTNIKNVIMKLKYCIFLSVAAPGFGKCGPLGRQLLIMGANYFSYTWTSLVA